MIDTTLIVGMQTEYNKYRLEELMEGYDPFIEEFSSFSSFLQWSRGVKKPLLKDRYLAIVNEELNMSRLEGRIATVGNLDNRYIKLILLVKPRERLFNLEFKDIEVINLSQTAMTDFKETIRRELDPIEDEGVNSIIRRIGLSYQTYLLYRKELMELEHKDPTSIATVIKEKKLRPTEYILLGVLSREKRMIREHYQLCNKYSEQWVLNHYRSTLGLVLWLKIRIQSGDMTLMDVRLSDRFNRMLVLVRDAKIGDVFMLKAMLGDRKMSIERYILQESTGALLRERAEAIEVGI